MKYVAILDSDDELSEDIINGLKEIVFVGDEKNPYCFDITSIKEEPKALEKEPCDDAVSRSMAIDKLKEHYWDKELQSAKDDPCVIDAMTDLDIRIIKDLPSVMTTQKKAQWIFVDKEHAYCSECGYGNVDLFNGRPHNYCPNCGAKMWE